MIKEFLLTLYMMVFWYLKKPQPSTHMHSIELCPPPKQYLNYLERYPNDISEGSKTPLELLPYDWYNLSEINDLINYSTQYRPDTEDDHVGADYWELAGSQGDCEDFALIKRKHLVELGIPRANLPLAVAVTETGIWHAVLAVVTTRGVYILDNRRSAIIGWEECKYTQWRLELSNTSKWSIVTED